MKLFLGILLALAATQTFARKSQPAPSTPNGVVKIEPAQVKSYYFAIASSLSDKTIICQRGADGYQYYLRLSMPRSS